MALSNITRITNLRLCSVPERHMLASISRLASLYASSPISASALPNAFPNIQSLQKKIEIETHFFKSAIPTTSNALSLVACKCTLGTTLAFAPSPASTFEFA